MEEQELPIDIHTSKLISWLMSRHHCSKDWQNELVEVRAKINDAIQDMPCHDQIAQLLSGKHINYHHCVKIVEILKETEADTKNLFGRYGSQRMKDWLEIIRLYEKNNVYLAELAQIFVRNVTYEIPSVNKQIAKLEQTHDECVKRENDLIKSEKSIMNEYNHMCQQLDVKNDKNVKEQLLKLVGSVNTIYDQIANDMKTVAPALQYYEALVQSQNRTLFTTLNYIICNGNTTTYQFLYGHVPVEIVETNQNKNDDSKNDDEIDFGDDDDIDFGDEITQVTPTLDDSAIQVEQSERAGVATGTDALRMLDNPETRNRILDELAELQSFLLMRLHEMSANDDVLILDVNVLAQTQTTQSVTELLRTVQAIVARMTSEKVEHLHNMKHSPNYVDFVCEKLAQKLRIVAQNQERRRGFADKRVACKRQAQDLKPALARLVNDSRVLQGQIERDISRRYNGRTVNLVGGTSVL